MPADQRALTGQILCLGVALALGTVAAYAHVQMSPAESKLGMRETYTLTVPSEGAAATISVVLDVPLGVNIVAVNAPVAEYTLAKQNGRITSVTWRVSIPSGGAKELTFVAQNPPGPTYGIRWNVHQIFADGSRADWIDPPPAKPAPITRLSRQ